MRLLMGSNDFIYSKPKCKMQQPKSYRLNYDNSPQKSKLEYPKKQIPGTFQGLVMFSSYSETERSVNLGKAIPFKHEAPP